MNKLSFIIVAVVLTAGLGVMLTQDDGGRLLAGGGSSCGSCSDDAKAPAEKAVTPKPKVTSAPAVKPSPEYVEFTLQDVNGKSQKLAAFNDREILVIKFGATWCPPCNAITPELNRLQTEYKNQLRVLTVYSGEDAKLVSKHQKSKKDTLPALIDGDGVVADKYRVSSIPAVYVFKGKTLVDKFIGYRSYDEIRTIVERGLP